MTTNDYQFDSVSQWYEDFILWHCSGRKKDGFYVDVGANHPEIDSVTKVMYDMGWRGINIEAVPEYAQRIAVARTRDITIGVGVGAEAGEEEFVIIGATVGGETSAKPEIVEATLKKNPNNKKVKVEIKTLTAILDAHLPKETLIDFCKIDVEGLEKAVLPGLDFLRYRPRLFCIGTAPLGQCGDYTEFEPMLISNDYDLAFIYRNSRYYADKKAKDFVSIMHRFYQLDFDVCNRQHSRYWYFGEMLTTQRNASKPPGIDALKTSSGFDKEQEEFLHRNIYTLCRKMSLAQNEDIWTLPCGVKFYLPLYPYSSFVQKAIADNHDFAYRKDLNFLAQYIPDDAVILDVGANIGNHSLFWASGIAGAPAKRIHAFEPVPATYQMLLRNITINDFGDVIIPHNIGLGDESRNGVIERSPSENIGGASIQEYAGGCGINRFVFRIERLDDIDLGEDRIDFVKIDVEGFELKTLSGMKNTLIKHHPVVWVESFPRHAPQVIAFFNEIGGYKEPVKSKYDYLFLPAFRNLHGK
jgi:FkbM family methyltransferase